MGKRKAVGTARAASSLSTKQRKHLKEFGEEHPFHDKVSEKQSSQIVELIDSSEQSSSESDAETEQEPLSAYQHLVSTLNNYADEGEEEEDDGEKEDDESEESEVDEDEEDQGDDNESEDEQDEEDPVIDTENTSSVVQKESEEGELLNTEAKNISDLEVDFTDATNETKFSLETNFVDVETDESEDEMVSPLNSSEDQFKQHVDTELEESDVTTINTKNKSIVQLKWTTLGQLVCSSSLPKFTPIGVLKGSDLRNLHFHKPLETTWPKVNGPLLSKDQLSHQQFFTPLQKELFSIINSYKDVYYAERTAAGNGEEVRHTYCLHAINHVLKANSRVLSNNSKCQDQKADVNVDFRDQGLTRPKVLIVVPFRESALRVVHSLINLLEVKDKLEVSNKKRFKDEFGFNPEDIPPNLKRPEDYEAMFAGNIDDHFRIGVSILRKSVRLYAPFYSSDIIVASPLGLRTIIKAEGDKKRDFDFLSSIEMLIIDQADVYLMQNWEHIMLLMKHLNLQPRESHGVDFSRVRMWCLNNWSKYYRQTLIFSAVQDPQINAIHNKHCFNYRGQVAVRNMSQTGSICQAVVQLPHVFQRVEVSSFTDLPDTRFQFFVNKILPQYREAVMSHTLIYIPVYFDYVRLRNYFTHEEINFAHICEYSKKGAVNRARDHFLKGEKPFVLFTERFHFYKRYTIRGIRHLIFYELPTYPQFYSEVCNMLKAENSGDEAAWTCTVLYSKYDAQKLTSVVGVERAAQMLQSKKNVHLFVTGENM
ncbi:U3 small nucleolar RNA-associated protein 25 homolog [Callorhinchus milii]|uniref:U3 small nucleolar RNA-associated protein 25 homolog n=1 Tax=Callorhinchus milii TaxID=7868 RepID=V9KE10_CALMI|nr:U3 small nucleolar RNA-associated protein 25 homolog [Callorhinchus milii]|eukprot:gi/632950342/ref/XP_007890663.1/ PREDICTED: digestive organ expansion factor homolog [Callorhinchus milii]